MNGKAFEELNFAELTEMLVSMAVPGKNKADLYTLKHEVEELNSQNIKILSKLSEYKDMSDDKYMDVARRMQDQTFLMQYQKDLANLKEEKADLDSKLKELKEQEELLHSKVARVNSTLTRRADEIHKMQVRMAQAEDEETKKLYETRIESEQIKNRNTEARAEKANNEYDDIQMRIESIVVQLEDINDEIQKNEVALQELEDRLQNNDAYVDQMRKLADLEKKERLAEELKEKETRKAEIVSNPVYLANQAVEAHLEGDPTLARKICEEIAKIATANNAYINEPNKESLKEALVAAEEARDTFNESLVGKAYESSRSSITDIRIDYLKGRIDSYQQEISSLKSKIMELDLDQKYGTDASIKKLEEAIATITESTEKYEELLSKKDEVSEEEINELQAAYEKEKKYLENAKAMRDGYTENYLQDLERIDRINKDIQSYEEDIKAYTSEIDKLEKERVLSGTNNKDILAQRKDMKTLQDKAKIVQDIKASLNFDKTPNQVLAQIDQILGIVITPADTQDKTMEAPQVQAPVVEGAAKEPTPAAEVKKEEPKEPIFEQETLAELNPNVEEKQPEVNENLAFQPAFGPVETVQQEIQKTPASEVTPVQATAAQTVTVNKNQIVANLANTGKIPVVGDSKQKVTGAEEVAVQQGQPVLEVQQPVQTEAIPPNKDDTNLMDFLNSNFQNIRDNDAMAEFFQSTPTEQEVSGPKLGG